jgi:hypothetical protein
VTIDAADDCGISRGILLDVRRRQDRRHRQRRAVVGGGEVTPARDRGPPYVFTAKASVLLPRGVEGTGLQRQHRDGHGFFTSSR